MRLRFYLDPETREPHIYQHDVDEQEVEDVLCHPGEDRQGRDNSRIALGQTRDVRYLRVVYLRDPEPQALFVLTAYDLRGKPLAAFQRRQRQRQRQ